MLLNEHEILNEYGNLNHHAGINFEPLTYHTNDLNHTTDHASDFKIVNGIEFIGEYEIVCGLEIHAQVNSETKLFSRAPNNFGDCPNSNVDFLDISFPGILPLLNEKCVYQAVKTGLALNCKINEVSFFERKHYFYPDLPSGYQISQLKSPICVDGFVKIDSISHGSNSDKSGSHETEVRINRIQLEQDAGKSIHDMSEKYSFVDLNRAGIPLMEIVSEPDIRSIAGAIAYVTKVRSILQYLNTSNARMELGEFRVDANISLRKSGEPLGNRVEIKNVNSIKFLEDALRYECHRQESILRSKGEVNQETRLFDAKNGVTASMRKKEDALDYRYFRDPDLFPVVISSDYIEKIRLDIPELPNQKSSRFMSEFGLNKYKADLLVNEKEIGDFFENTIRIWKEKIWKESFHDEVSKEKSNFSEKLLNFANYCCNWLIGDVFALMNERNESGSNKIMFSHENFAHLVSLILSNAVSGKSAKDVLQKMWASDKNPHDIVSELGLSQVNDEGEILNVVSSVLNENASEVERYLNGNDKLFGFFVGQAMKKSGGKFNASLLNEILKSELEKRRDV